MPVITLRLIVETEFISCLEQNLTTGFKASLGLNPQHISIKAPKINKKRVKK